MKNLFWILEILFFCPAYLFPQEVLILPEPKVIEYMDNYFALDKSELELKLFMNDTARIGQGINELNEEFSTLSGITLKKSNGTNVDLLIGLKNADSRFDLVCYNIGFNLNNELGSEGYELKIDDRTIILAANEVNGLYYGIQTLKQILRSSYIYSFLPGITIRDFPTLKYRGVIDDISRGPIPTLEYMKYQIRRLAELKINYFSHYVEHVVKTKSHPSFAPNDGSLTIEEWKDLADYAEKYFITLGGNFQSFGHFNNILQTPGYEHLGESGSLLSPVLPESIEFLKDIYEEMVPAFNCDWFCVNCDETFDLGKGYSKERVEEVGYAQVYYEHVMNIYSVLKSMGKRTLIWGDIMLKYPELLDKFPKDMIIGTWTYDAKESFDDFIDPFVNKGFDVFITPGILNSRRVMPDWGQTITNIHNFVRDGAKQNVMGMANTVWDDGGFAFFSIDWYGVAYSADQSWHPQKMDIPYFNQRFNQAVNIDSTDYFTEAILKLKEIGDFVPTNGMNQKIVWMKLIPEKNKSLNLSTDEWDRVEEVCDQARGLLWQASPQLNGDEILYFDFIVDLYRFLAQIRYNLLEASEQYNDAAGLQKENPNEARSRLINIIDIIDETITIQENIITEYRNLWLNENHTYSLDIILNRFRDVVHDLQEIENLVFESLKNLDSGESIFTKSEVRLDINKVSGKYFREWMMINPLPNTDGLPASKIDYLLDMGGEKNAQPKITQEFYYNNHKYRWRRVETGYFDIVDLDEIFPEESTNTVMYAHAEITSNENRTVTASMGSEEGITVFLNGEIVHEFQEKRILQPDEDEFVINLKEGKNHLLLKITQLEGDWGFTFKLLGQRVTNSKNRYYIVD